MDVLGQKVRELAQRDPAAATALLHEALAEELARFLAKRLPASEVDDLSSEVWLAVQEGVAGFTGLDVKGSPVQVKTWVFAIGRNKAASLLRRSTREVPVGPRSIGGEGGSEHAPDRGVPVACVARDSGADPALDLTVSRLIDDSRNRPSRKLAAAEESALVARLVRALPPSDQRLLRWRYADDQTARAWLDLVEREGCARELGIEAEMKRYLAANGEARASLGERIVERLEQQLTRAKRKVRAAWDAAVVNPPGPEAKGRKGPVE